MCDSPLETPYTLAN